MLLIGALPFRSTANALKIAFETLPGMTSYFSPSCTTVKRWAQQIGYYKLNRPKRIAKDWMIMIDASIQMGEKKCVMILGSPMADIPNNRALKLEDLEVLAMRVVPRLNGEVIEEMLEEIQVSIGKISSICSDKGSEMVRGITLFQKYNSELRHITDTAHRVSNFLEKILEKSEQWKLFRQLTTQARRQMQNSLVSGAQPPSPRTKARYMNVDSIIIWASKMLLLLDHGDLSDEIESNKLNIKELRKYLGWLESYREDIGHWNLLIAAAAAARQLVRTEGIHMNIVDSFDQAISSLPLSQREMPFVNQIIEFLLSQSFQVKPEEYFIGSTEVLESFFGKLKYMEREQRGFGFTSLLLAAIANIGPLTDNIVVDAISSVKLSDIEEWTKKNIGISTQSQRRHIKKISAKLQAKAIEMERKPSGAFQAIAA